MASLRDIRSRLSPAARNELARRGGTAATSDATPVELPLNFSQRRLLTAGELDPDSAFYTLSCALRIDGHLDIPALRQSLNAVVQQHVLLRSRVRKKSRSEIFFVIQPDSRTPLRVVDFSDVEAGRREPEALRILAAESGHVFRLESEAPLRVTLCRLSATTHFLHIYLHHIVGDQWSLELLRRDLWTAYMASRGGSLPLPEPSGAFGDLRHGDVGHDDSSVQYWLNALAGAPPYIDFPARVPTREGRHKGVRRYIAYSDLSQRIEQLGRDHGCTAFMVLVAALSVAVARWTGQTDFCIGTRVAGRRRLGDREKVSFLVNLLALRTTLAPEDTLADCLARTRETVLEALTHEHVPFETVIEKLRLPRDGIVSPLIPLVITHQNVPAAADRPSETGISVTPLKIHNGTVRTELDFSFEGKADTLELALEYRSDMFDEADMLALVDLHRGILARMAEDASSRLGDLFGQLQPDGGSLLEGGVAAEEDSLIEHRLRHAVSHHPERTAVVDGARELSYADLEGRSSALASGLRSLGLADGSPVLLYMERSADWILCSCACLRAGIPYMTLDPALGEGYKRGVIAGLRPALVIAAECAGDEVVQTLRVLAPGDLLSCAAAECLHPREMPPEATAYWLLTSGSTGAPRLVSVPRRQLFNCVASAIRRYPLAEREIFAQRTTSGFAPSVKEWCVAFAGGATVVVVRPEDAADAQRLLDAVVANAITRLHLTPSLLRLLLKHAAVVGAAMPSLRYVVVAGEPLSPDLAQAFAVQVPSCRLLNNYGCTELNDITYETAAAGRAPVTAGAGTPGANTSIYILDSSLRIVARGVAGSIYVSGASLGPGYPGNASLTAQKYLPDPFADLAGARMFCTGDVGRIGASGSLELLGRSDDVLKVNGCRVEPRQVESAISRFPGVNRVVVLGERNAAGQPTISAFVQPASIADGMEALRRHLADLLPRYMHPSRIEYSDAFPMLPNGKIDRVGLRTQARSPAPGGRMADGEADSAAKVAIRGLWREVLQVQDSGIEDDFFSLGGTSLSALEMLSGLRDRCGVDVSTSEFFGRPTLSLIFGKIDEAQGPEPGRNDASAGPHGATSAPMLPTQRRFWILNQLLDDRESYNIPIRLRFRTRPTIGDVRDGIVTLLRRHPALRARFRPSGADCEEVVQEDGGEFGAFGVIDVRQGAATETAWHDMAAQRFDLGLEGPVRAALVMDDENWQLWIILHHIATDARTGRLLARDLAKALRGETLDGKLEWSEYAAICTAQRNRVDDRVRQGLQQWRSRLSSIPSRLSLPKPPHVDAASERFRQVRFDLTAADAARLKNLAQARSTTLFVLFLSAIYLLLRRRAERHDVTIGTTVDVRESHEAYGVAGCFVNTVPLRIRAAGETSVGTLVKDVRSVVSEAIALRDVPYDRLVEALRPSSTAATELFDVLYQHLDAAATTGASDDEPVAAVDGAATDPLQRKFDLYISTVQTREGITGTIEFDSHRVAAAFAEEMAQRIVGLATRMEEMLALPLDAVPVGTQDVAWKPTAAQTEEEVSDGPRSGIERGETTAVPSGSGDAQHAMRKLILRTVAEVLPDALPLTLDSNFFQQGGNSLRAMRAAARLSANLGFKVSARSIYENPRLSDLAGIIERRAPGPTETKTVPATEVASLLALFGDAQIHRPNPIPESAEILLTGATGFLGAHLLASLQNRTRSRVWCLIRCRSEQDGLARLMQCGGEYGLSLDPARIVAVRGDVGAPALGLDANAAARIREVVGHVYHCAADDDFLHPYETLRPTNVLSVVELGRLALSANAMCLHFVSTRSVLDAADASAAEKLNQPWHSRLDTGYAQSKWVGEQLLVALRRRGVRCAVYRPSRIVAGRATRKVKPQDLFNRMIRGIWRLGLHPGLEGTDNLVPVDFAAEAIVALSLSADRDGCAFPIQSETEIQIADLLASVRSRLRADGRDLATGSRDAWLRAIADDDPSQQPLYPLLPFFQPDGDIAVAKSAEPARTTAVRTPRLLRTLGVHCPAFDQADLDHLVGLALAQCG